ncbi:MAG: Gfo/Idh/MocA family oxidoreductase [Thermodesulfovibrionales bacterium]|nr:Gfo/Idh/MocA family oxidoreductase [Thermodesulfovibrionales bacterium]
MLKVGVIGVGYLGQHHARIFSELENVELVAVVDIDIHKTKSIAAKHKSIPYTNFREILDKVDAISIVTPTETHFEIALECLKAGKDIFIEKPITKTIKDSEILIEESERRGKIIQVGHIERFNPAVLKVYQYIEDPIFFEAERLSPFTGRGIDVDIILDLMIHDIDIILSILSTNGYDKKVKDLKAVAAKVLTDHFDVAKVWLDFSCNIQASMTACRLSSGKSRKLKILQRNSHIILDYQNMGLKRFYKQNGEIVSDSIFVEKKEPLKEELKDFIECVITRRKPRVTAVDGLNALDLALQITREIKT